MFDSKKLETEVKDSSIPGGMLSIPKDHGGQVGFYSILLQGILESMGLDYKKESDDSTDYFVIYLCPEELIKKIVEILGLNGYIHQSSSGKKVYQFKGGTKTLWKKIR